MLATFALGLLRYSRESLKQADGFGSLQVYLTASSNSGSCSADVFALLFQISDVDCEFDVSLYKSVLGSGHGAIL